MASPHPVRLVALEEKGMERENTMGHGGINKRQGGSGSQELSELLEES